MNGWETDLQVSGYYLAKTCGCSGGTEIWKHPAGRELKIRTRRQEVEVYINGVKQQTRSLAALKELL